MKQQPNFKTTIGGQALIEGILMRGPQKTAIVVRKSDGEFAIKEDDVGTVHRSAVARLPLVRGVIGFWDSMKYGISALTYSADFFDDGTEYGEPGRFEQWLTRKFGQAKLDKLFEDPSLLRAPIVRNGRQATVGYCPQVWETWS